MFICLKKKKQGGVGAAVMDLPEMIKGLSSPGCVDPMLCISVCLPGTPKCCPNGCLSSWTCNELDPRRGDSVVPCAWRPTSEIACCLCAIGPGRGSCPIGRLVPLCEVLFGLEDFFPPPFFFSPVLLFYSL